MTDEEKEKYRDGLIATCKVYCHIDYDDDMEILELIRQQQQQGTKARQGCRWGHWEVIQRHPPEC